MKLFCTILSGLLLMPTIVGIAQEPQAKPADAPVASESAKPVPPPENTPKAAPAPAPGAPQQTGTAAAIDPNHYVIGAEDSLQITVWKEPTLSGTVPVRPDGQISMALLGDVKAAGLTPMALGADISERLKKYIQDPLVTVVVLAVNSQRIFLIGEVGRAGPLMLTPKMTPLEAIAAAGGLSTFAKSKKIYILRGPPGAQQKIFFNYKAALKGDNKQSVSLLPGDTIIVP
jgi:polysaccharide export outer membrane protein